MPDDQDINSASYQRGELEKAATPYERKWAMVIDLDRCTGCHACEAACSEKNENPAHLAFRSVGYVEGGSFPDYKRMNISMACNHCDDPVCLKGCPTRAYTKHTEYGAVLQDPDTCFGCGYCTWVCPYNAPQLDPPRVRVPLDVRQNFLCDPVDLTLHIQRKIYSFVHARLGRKLIVVDGLRQQKFECRYQTDILKHRRAQVLTDAADLCRD